MSCTKLNEGCLGGFSYLIGGRYGQDQGFVAEECFPYQGVVSHIRFFGYMYDCIQIYSLIRLIIKSKIISVLFSNPYIAHYSLWTSQCIDNLALALTCSTTGCGLFDGPKLQQNVHRRLWIRRRFLRGFQRREHDGGSCIQGTFGCGYHVLQRSQCVLWGHLPSRGGTQSRIRTLLRKNFLRATNLLFLCFRRAIQFLYSVIVWIDSLAR